MNKTDLIIIGAGPGGYRAAAFAASRGLQVILFEASKVGGTCLNEGCIPTKSFAKNAELVQALKEAATYGLDSLHYELDFKQVVNRKDQVLDSLRTGIETLLSHPNITLVRDVARFTDSHTVADSAGNIYTAPNIIVATGSVPKQLRLESYDEGAACDSEFLLRNDTLPRRLCIVGAGVIGMEFASIFNAFGVEVTVVEFLKECLPALDSDIAKRLRKTMEKRGINFIMQAGVKSIVFKTEERGERREESEETKNERGEGLERIVTYTRKGKEETIVADQVLMAVGRKPRVSADFANAGFEWDERTGIHVDEHFQTTIPGIYAIGDVNGRQMLAHRLVVVDRPESSIYVVERLLRGETSEERESLEVIPAAIFTHPEAACVGLSEDQCREQNIAYTCRKSFYRANGKALAMNETEGMLKLLSDADDRIIGCHVFGAHAADLAQEASVLICKHATVDELRHMVHIHPTLSEVLLAASEM